MFTIKRIYDPPEQADGYRVLVDRLWPRGMSKAKAQLDLWDKDIAPSAQLRTWFGHKPERFEQFAAQYIQELDAHRDAVDALYDLERQHGTVTLLYAAHDPDNNHARVLLQYMQHQ